MNRTFCTLDRNRCGPSLFLDESDLKVTCTEIVNGNRTILGNIFASAGEFSFEAYFWSESRVPQQFAIGIAEPNADLSQRLGSNPQSYAYWPAEGKAMAAGVDVGTVGTSLERTCLGVRLTLGPTSAMCDWLVNGSTLYSRALPPGKVWLPGLSLGADRAGGVFASVNFGNARFDTLPWRQGWSEARPGVRNLHLSLITEGVLAKGRADQLTPFRPYILDAERIAVRRQVYPWWQRAGDSSGGAAVTIVLDNADGTFNELRDADARDAKVVIMQVESTGHISEVPRVIFTGIIERVSEGSNDEIEIVLKDTLSRLDKPLPMKLIPPFYESGGRPVPVGLGAQRTIEPILLDEPERIFLLGDAPMTNITEVCDMGARLDPHSLPPQYDPVMDSRAIQLRELPVGRLSADCSSTGPQYDIPGESDVLNGIGNFQTWSDGQDVPTAWEQGGEGVLRRILQHGIVDARLSSEAPWYPHPYGTPVTTGRFGKWIKTVGTPLIGGRSYRIFMRIRENTATPPTSSSGSYGGIMLRTDLSNDRPGAISTHGVAIREVYRNGYVLDFKIPPGPAKPLYILVVASSGTSAGRGNGTAFADISDIRIQMLGQYQDLPLLGIGVKDAFEAILVDRLGEDPNIFSVSDAEEIDSQYTYPVGYRWEEAPNVLDALTEIADQYGAILFTDETGQIRIRQVLTPSEPVATFDSSNIQENTLRFHPDEAASLTTNFAGRPNWSPYGSGDFVTNIAEMPPSRKMSLMMDFQFLATSQLPLAGEYEFARGAERMRYNIDTYEGLIAQFKEIMVNYAKRRQIIRFVGLHDGKLSSGMLPERLYLGHTISVHVPHKGLDNSRVVVLGTSNYPAGNKIEITGWL